MGAAARPALILGCLLALLFACFRGALFGDEQFGYRDAGHYYYPLYLRVQQEWEAGRLPLWEPEENAGMPLLGNPTAAVLYPGKLIYAALPYAWGARIYVIAHTLLAFAGLRALLRVWGVSQVGAALGGLSYAFAAPVLFQYCNIIFLVGAAWLPWGLRAIDRLLRQGRAAALPELAAILAMQALGGDPQMAYLTALSGAGYAGLLARSDPGARPGRLRRWMLPMIGLATAWVAGTFTLAYGSYLERWVAHPVARGAQVANLGLLGHAADQPAWARDLLAMANALLEGRWEPLPAETPTWHLISRAARFALWASVAVVLIAKGRRGGPARGLLNRMLVLGAASALALGLAAAQLIPVVEYTNATIRSAEEGTLQIFPFSLEPHRALELIWPNLFGTTFAGNHFWLPILPPLHSVSPWVPSIYMGGLALVLAFVGASLRGGPPWRTWMTAMVLLSFVAALGEFGSPIWWARRTTEGIELFGPPDPGVTEAARQDNGLANGDGSVYGALARLLPLFGSFRYPSKLLTLTCLGLAALAGIGWDRLAEGRSRRMTILAASLLVLSTIGAGLAFVGQARFVAFLRANESIASGGVFGPIEPGGAAADLRLALLQGVVVYAIALVLARAVPARRRWAGALALGLVAADLIVGNARLVQTVPQTEFEADPRLLEIIRQAERDDPSPGPFRIHRMPLWHPARWSKEPSDHRSLEFVRWERATLQPKYGVPLGVEYTLTEGVAELYDYWWFFGGFYRKVDPKRIKLPGIGPEGTVVYHPRRGYDLWNTRYFIVPFHPGDWTSELRSYASFVPNSRPIAPDPGRFRGDGGAGRMRDWVWDQDWQIFKNEDAYPRAWVVHAARSIPAIEGLSKADRQLPMQEMLYPADLFWYDPDRVSYDPHHLAWIDETDLGTLSGFLPGSPPDPAESVRIDNYGPRRVVIDVDLRRPGIVVLADVFYPGWRLTIDGEPAPIWRANRLMRGAAVESGRHRLIYTYDPPSFKIGAALTIGSLALAAALLGLASRRTLPIV